MTAEASEERLSIPETTAEPREAQRINASCDDSSWQNEEDDSQTEDKSDPGTDGSLRTRKQKSDRIAKLTFPELQPFFNMPLYEAAARLKICGTVLKRVSRRCGIPTWPFRQIRDLNSRIESLKGLMETANGKKLETMMREVRQLTKTRDHVLETGQLAESRSRQSHKKRDPSTRTEPVDTTADPRSVGRYDRTIDGFSNTYLRSENTAYPMLPSMLLPMPSMADTNYMPSVVYGGLDYRKPDASFSEMHHRAFREAPYPGSYSEMTSRPLSYGMGWHHPYLSHHHPMANEQPSVYPMVSPTLPGPAYFDDVKRKRSFPMATTGGMYPSKVSPYLAHSGYEAQCSIPMQQPSLRYSTSIHTVDETDSETPELEHFAFKRAKRLSEVSFLPNSEWQALVAASAQARAGAM